MDKRGHTNSTCGWAVRPSAHSGICVYRMTLHRLHRVGEIDASIPMTLVGGHGEGQHPDLSLLILRLWLVSFSRFTISRFNDSARAIAIMGMAQHSAATTQKAHLPFSHFFCVMGQFCFILSQKALNFCCVTRLPNSSHSPINIVQSIQPLFLLCRQSASV